MKLLVLLFAFLGVAYCVQFKITNLHGGPIQVGIQGNPGHEHLERGGFVLNQGQSRTINSNNNWQGRFWARTWCMEDNHCQTGDCGNKVECNGAGGVPPATLVEISLRAHAGQDFYDISLVDGYNSMASIKPINGRGDCKQLSCKRELNGNCPNELRQVYNGQTVGCKSACLKTNDPKYCCIGPYLGEQNCKPDTWPSNLNSAKYFKDNCPQAYSYAFDDRSSLFTCVADTYDIEFG